MGLFLIITALLLFFLYVLSQMEDEKEYRIREDEAYFRILSEAGRREHRKTMGDLDCEFSYEEEELFERIWVAFNVNHQFKRRDELSDDQYIKYRQWENINQYRLYDKHLPNSVLLSGSHKHNNIIFHGGCLGCKSQEIYGVDRCRGCQYFRAEWYKPDLSIEK